MSFFREFVRDPGTLGAVAPSVPALAGAATAGVVYAFLLPPVKRLRAG
ncbi:hypothetical protein [Amycolatopsis sp. NPDC050768]